MNIQHCSTVVDTCAILWIFNSAVPFLIPVWSCEYSSLRHCIIAVRSTSSINIRKASTFNLVVPRCDWVCCAYSSPTEEIIMPIKNKRLVMACLIDYDVKNINTMCSTSIVVYQATNDCTMCSLNTLCVFVISRCILFIDCFAADVNFWSARKLF